MRRFTIALTLLAVITMTGQGRAQERTVVIDRSHPARSARLHVGDTLVIHLRATGGLGYKWVLGRIDPKVLTLLGTTSSPANPKVLGGPIDQVFRFQGVGVGEAMTPFTLKHQAAGVTVIGKHYRCTVRVTRPRAHKPE